MVYAFELKNGIIKPLNALNVNLNHDAQCI